MSNTATVIIEGGCSVIARRILLAITKPLDRNRSFHLSASCSLVAPSFGTRPSVRLPDSAAYRTLEFFMRQRFATYTHQVADVIPGRDMASLRVTL